jgi:hypothetical protein
MNAVTRELLVAFVWLHTRVARRGRERGDLVGWILITVMTAALVAVLWQFLGGQLQQLLQSAINRARGSIPGGP